MGEKGKGKGKGKGKAKADKGAAQGSLMSFFGKK